MGFRFMSMGLNSYAFLLESGVHFVIEPTYSNPWKITPIKRESYPPPDVIFVTHGDASHPLFEVPRLLTETDALCIASPEVCDYLAGMGRGFDIPSRKLVPVEWGDRIQVKGVDLLITRSMHMPLRNALALITGGKQPEVELDAPIEKSGQADAFLRELIPSYADRAGAVVELFGEHLPPRGPCLGFYMATDGGHTIWYSGSYVPTGYTQILAEKIRPEIAFVQVTATMEQDAGWVAGTMKPALAIPIHQDKNFDDQPGDEADTERFAREVKRLSPTTRTMVPKIGQWYELELSAREVAG
jgi:L-ascorbate metabolism protein UlaG (beta-lactamase superfamily)